MDPRIKEHVEPNIEVDTGDVFNDIMNERAEMFDCDSNQRMYDGVQKNKEGGWFVYYRSAQFWESLRKFIYQHDVKDMSYFVGEEFESLIEERAATPLVLLQAKRAKRIVLEILDSQDVPMTKSANKR